MNEDTPRFHAHPCGSRSPNTIKIPFTVQRDLYACSELEPEDGIVQCFVVFLVKF